MQDMLQRLSIIMMLCVGAVAFIATSPGFPVPVSKSMRPITIQLSKKRPIRQFTMTIRDNSTPNVSLFNPSHQINYEVIDVGTQLEKANLLYSVAVKPLSDKPDICFTNPGECEWKELPLGESKRAETRPNQSVPQAGLLLFSDGLRFDNQGARVFIKFKLAQDEPVKLTWTYTFFRTPDSTSDETFDVNSPMVDIASQEIPVD